MIEKLRPDMIVLTETRTNASYLIQNIRPGAKIAQVTPRTDTGSATRAGVFLATRTGSVMFVTRRWEIA